MKWLFTSNISHTTCKVRINLGSAEFHKPNQNNCGKSFHGPENDSSDHNTFIQCEATCGKCGDQILTFILRSVDAAWHQRTSPRLHGFVSCRLGKCYGSVILNLALFLLCNISEWILTDLVMLRFRQNQFVKAGPNRVGFKANSERTLKRESEPGLSAKFELHQCWPLTSYRPENTHTCARLELHRGHNVLCTISCSFPPFSPFHPTLT